MIRWIKGNRYYEVQTQKNLFNTTSVICSWGSINTKLGGFKIILCDTPAEATDIIEALKKRRTARGYKIATPNPEYTHSLLP